MNLSLDTILTNARELVSRLRRDDATADSTVSQAQYVQERILSMKQYGDDLAELNDISSHRPKTAILYSIQKENRLIKQLQKENEELKQLVTEHRSVLEKIMYKYRQHVQQLRLMEEKEKMAVQLFNAGLAQEVQEKASKIQEMASIMQRAIDIDEINSATQEERINALLVENRGLKEILAVHENMHQHKQLSTIIPQLYFKRHTDSTLIWTENILLLSIGTIVLFAVLTLAGVVYWCSKQQQQQHRLLKNQPEPSELTPFSSTNNRILKPKEITLFPIAHKFADLHASDITNDTYSLSSTSSSEHHTAKTSRNKNLLQRRGPNNALTISVAPVHLVLNSPPADCSTDEYLQTATRKLTINELHQHAQDTRSLYQEFWVRIINIDTRVPTNHLEKLRIYGAGTKNRYGTIIANEHSRVKLPELAGDSISSYINANYVNGWPNEYHAFIATQGPLSNTIIDFYRMIWQEHVPVIVMITRLFEKNKSKCERYIPDSHSNQYGPFHVEIKSTIYRNDYEIRRLIITFENEQREIDHYWYTAWPDQSCPDIAKPLIELVDKVENSRIELSKINNKSGPVVVHCSAGIGRTGCFIALSNGIKQLNQERVVDIVRIICNLRRDRGGMIQTHDQYQFLYQALSEYARTLQ
ncbi:unnamed protein product [Adineta steineri]|uniref:protein-tyrosine-phosphatase n=1 Tax=Adineta steineri TaxID=433720 RepID=A0A815MIA8_9BILA|nr:unnamed protein product [Adineta steineri]